MTESAEPNGSRNAERERPYALPACLDMAGCRECLDPLVAFEGPRLERRVPSMGGSEHSENPCEGMPHHDVFACPERIPSRGHMLENLLGDKSKQV